MNNRPFLGVSIHSLNIFIPQIPRGFGSSWSPDNSRRDAAAQHFGRPLGLLFSIKSANVIQFFIPLLFLLTPVQAVFPISVEGNEFFNSVTKQRFVIVGVAYQPGGASGYDPAHGVDPLSDPKKCLRGMVRPEA